MQLVKQDVFLAEQTKIHHFNDDDKQATGCLFAKLFFFFSFFGGLLRDKQLGFLGTNERGADFVIHNKNVPFVSKVITILFK